MAALRGHRGLLTKMGNPTLGSPTYTYNSALFSGSSGAASGYLYRTFGTPTNQNKWTVSVWIKRVGTGGRYDPILNAWEGAVGQGSYVSLVPVNFAGVAPDNDRIGSTIRNANFTIGDARLTDTTAFHHLVWAFDSSQASPANRMRIYLDGVELGQIMSGVSVGATSEINSASAVMSEIGRITSNYGPAGQYLSAYLADFYFVDGQQLTPTAFAYDNTGLWSRVTTPWAGTFGNNGFHLDFHDNADLGKDVSGRGNHWTVTPANVTAATIGPP